MDSVAAGRYNAQKGQLIKIPECRTQKLYRGQKKPSASGEIRLPYYFTANTKNRMTPSCGSVKTSYFGGTPLTCILESFPVFREVSLENQRGRIPIGWSELNKFELVELKLTTTLELCDITTESALIRHRVKSCITSNIDVSQANDFSREVYCETNFDGIYYRTRQGAEHAVCLYERAKNKIANATEESRMSFAEYFIQNPDLVDGLHLELIDDN